MKKSDELKIDINVILSGIMRGECALTGTLRSVLAEKIHKYAQAYADEQSRDKAFDCVDDYYHYIAKCKEEDVHTELIEVWFKKWWKSNQEENNE